jgi:hypothetical protein
MTISSYEWSFRNRFGCNRSILWFSSPVVRVFLLRRGGAIVAVVVVVAIFDGDGIDAVISGKP